MTENVLAVTVFQEDLRLLHSLNSEAYCMEVFTVFFFTSNVFHLAETLLYCVF